MGFRRFAEGKRMERLREQSRLRSLQRISLPQLRKALSMRLTIRIRRFVLLLRVRSAITTARKCWMLWETDSTTANPRCGRWLLHRTYERRIRIQRTSNTRRISTDMLLADGRLVDVASSLVAIFRRWRVVLTEFVLVVSHDVSAGL